MSFIFGAIRPGTNSLHRDRESAVNSQQRHLRKSRTYGDLLTPFARVVRDPVGSLGDVLEGLGLEGNPNKRRRSEDEESRRQVLYLRMKEVRWISSQAFLDKNVSLLLLGDHLRGLASSSNRTRQSRRQ